MIRALLFTNLFPSPVEPQRGLFNLNRFRALAELCPVHVVVPVAAWKRALRPVELVRATSQRWDGIVATYPTNWTVPRLAPHLHAREMYRSVRSHVAKVHREFPFDVILGAFGYPDAVVAAALGRDAGCPVVALVQGSDINELAQRPRLRDEILEGLTSATRVVAVSDELRQRLEELGVAPDRIVVQHNGVDGDLFHIREKADARSELDIPADTRLVCFVGNLVDEKGPDVLLEAIADPTFANTRRVEVVFIGDGVRKARLQARAAAVSVDSRVHFTGRRPSTEVARWIAAADVLCLPSRREGCPNAVLESLASGRPVVATTVGAVPQLVTQTNGLTVPPGDSRALATALDSCLKRTWDPQALRRTVPALNWNDMGRTLHTVLSDCVPKSQPHLPS